MDDFSRRLITEWRKLKLPFAGKTFVAAVSGGADSVGLLLALAELRKRKKLEHRFVAAHFNHNLRGGESDADAEFVKNLSVEFDFELVIGDGKISAEGNLEQNARLARYDFLQNAAENLRADGVLTAHTVNDQAETFLINLLRGSGISGLAAMKTVRRLNEDRADSPLLIRPLLSWAKRGDTENYCRQHEIKPRFDQMNEDLKFSRVRVRKILLPLMKEFNPKIIETLARTAELLRLKSEGKDGETGRRGDGETRFAGVEIALNQLRNLSKSDVYDVLRDWLEYNIGNLRGLELKHIAAIEILIASRKSGKIVELPGGVIIVKEKGKLAFKNFKVEK